MLTKKSETSVGLIDVLANDIGNDTGIGNTEKFINKIQGETIKQRRIRLDNFLTKEKLKDYVSKGYSIKSIAKELGVTDDAISTKLKLFELKTVFSNYKVKEDASLTLSDDDLDKIPPPQFPKNDKRASKLSDEITKDDLVILSILAYCKPNKKIIENTLELLSNNFAKNVALYNAKLKSDISIDEIGNANYISQLATKALRFNQ